MQLTLERIEQKVGALTHLAPLDLALAPGTVNVLLGATQAGKTTLLRLMAGLNVPSSGRISVDGLDVTGMSVRSRNVAMVYQQFINYPSMSVFDNIASPLKLRRGAAAGPGGARITGRATTRLGQAEIGARVQALAEKLHIESFLDRLPAELSGGQQQRVALARAMAKDAPPMLLDEPLVNLDYKLREELRDELTALFAAGDSTVVYATTEPTEALLLGGWTAVLDAGELLQYGPTAQVFHHPASIRVARAFSDPPMNLVGLRAGAGAALKAALDAGLQPGSALRDLSGDLSGDPSSHPSGDLAGDMSGDTTLGLRASALRVRQRPGDIVLPGSVELAEISGSDTFVHAATSAGELVAQLSGVHFFALGAPITLYFDPAQVYVFGADGLLIRAPRRAVH